MSLNFWSYFGSDHLYLLVFPADLQSVRHKRESFFLYASSDCTLLIYACYLFFPEYPDVNQSSNIHYDIELLILDGDLLLFL
jgi:hypothetical protein